MWWSAEGTQPADKGDKESVLEEGEHTCQKIILMMFALFKDAYVCFM